MSEMKRNPEAVAEMIRNAKTIALCCHVNPDGDTLGSTFAMRLALLEMGKTVSAFCDGKVPDSLSFLPGAETMRCPGKEEGPFDLMLSLDVSDEQRLGACAGLKEVSSHTAQIDHHSTNPLFMEVNSVDGTSPACCLLVREQIRTLGIGLNTDIAVCLYTGISTDTGNFAFASTNTECFQVMQELMEQQLPLSELNRRLFLERAKPQVLLLGKALKNLVYYEHDQIAVMTLTRKDFLEAGALSEHADTLVNFGLNTVGTRFAILAREAAEGGIKLSLRAKEPDTVDDIAGLFGGGGHLQASGIKMAGTLEETVRPVLEAMIRKLNEKR